MSGSRSQIGRYELVDLLGRGGMAEVWRVRIPQRGGTTRDFALKRIVDSGEDDGTQVALFAREAKVTQSLFHPNIVQVYDFFYHAGAHYLVMEFIEGRNLAELIKRTGPIPPATAAFITAQVCEGLRYAHEKPDPDTGKPLRIVHRDISPQNVMLGFDGSVKLVDFGIARPALNATLTQVGIVRGKIAYMAPEQIRGMPLDQRCDVYALSLVLLEMLAGRAVFGGSDYAQVIADIKHANYPPPRELVPDLAPKLEALLHLGLAKKVEERLPSAGQMLVLLRDYLEEGEGADESDVARLMRSGFPQGGTPGKKTASLSAMAPTGSDGEALLLQAFQKLEELEPPSVTEETKEKPPAPRRLPILPLAGAILASAAGVALWIGQPARERERDVQAIPSEAPPTPLSIATTIPTSAPSPAPTVAPTPLSPTPTPVAFVVPTSLPESASDYDALVSQAKAQGADRPALALRYHDTGLALLKAGHLEVALGHFRASRTVDPGRLTSWVEELKILKKIGRDAEARQTARSLVEKNPALGRTAILKPYLE